MTTDSTRPSGPEADAAKAAKGGVNPRVYAAVERALRERPEVIHQLRQVAALGWEIAERALAKRAEAEAAKTGPG